MSQVKVRVGQTDAIKVLSSGLLSDTAFNVVGGIASVTSLTVTGAVNFGQPVQFGTGTIFIKGDEDEILVGSGLSLTDNYIDIRGDINVLQKDYFDNLGNRIISHGNLFVGNNLKSVGITTLASAGGITTTGGDLFVGNNLEVAGSSNFIGVATFRGGTINLGDSDSDDINVGGEFTSGLIPNTAGLYNVGSVLKPWKNGNFSGIITATDLNISGLSTHVGVATFQNNVFVDGTLTAGLIDGGSF
jgi:hypothetical protein